jgi:hypothetical protein
MSETSNGTANGRPEIKSRQSLLLAISWLWVGVPLLWGVWRTLYTSLALFQ